MQNSRCLFRSIEIIQNKTVIYTQIPYFTTQTDDQRINNVNKGAFEEYYTIHEDTISDKSLWIGKLEPKLRYSQQRSPTIDSVFESIIELQVQNLQYSQRLQYNLEKICNSVTVPDKRRTTPLLKLSKLVLNECSTVLIEEIVKYFTSIEWKGDRQQKLESLVFKDCYISDSKLKLEITKFDSLYLTRLDEAPAMVARKGAEQPKAEEELFSFSVTEILIDRCPNITSQFLASLENWTISWNTGTQNYMTDFIFEKVKNSLQYSKFGLKNINNAEMTSLDFIKFSTTPYFKFLRSLKLKNFAYSMPTILKDMLSSKLLPKMKESDPPETMNDQFVSQAFCSKLVNLSFDSSVCENFDQLPLNQEYWQTIKKLSFENVSGEKELIDVNFSQMLPYSLKNLQIMKIKRCNLGPAFFENLSRMTCSLNIRILSLSECKIDCKSFRTFLHAISQNTLLSSIDLSGTNIIDDTCFAIAETFSHFETFTAIDISRCNKITHKGVKELMYITSLRQICIDSLPQAVTDNLASFIVDLMKRKQKKFLAEKLQQELEEELQRIQESKQKEDEENYYPMSNVVQFCRSQKMMAEGQSDEIKNAPPSGSTVQQILGDQFLFLKCNFKEKTDLVEQLNAHQKQELERINKANELKKKAAWQIKNDKLTDVSTQVKLYKHLPDFPQLRQISLMKNTRVTSAFLDDLNENHMIEKLENLNLSGTSVCGHIFKILSDKPTIQQVKVEEEVVKKDVDEKKDAEVADNATPGTPKQVLKPAIEGSTEKTSQKASTASLLEQNSDKADMIGSRQKLIGENLALNKNMESDAESQPGKEEGIQQGNSEDDAPPAKDDEDEQVGEVSEKGEGKKDENKGDVAAVAAAAISKEPEVVVSVNKKVSAYENAYLQFLDLSNCTVIQSVAFQHLFETKFIALEHLKLIGLSYFDSEFEIFLARMNKNFAAVKYLNLSSSHVNRPLMQKFFEKTTLELVELQMNQCKVDDSCILKASPSLKKSMNRISLASCLLFETEHLLTLLETMGSNQCFDFNYSIKQFSHLVSKKFIYQIIEHYSPLQNQHVLNISSAALCDIDVSYWDHTAVNDIKISNNSRLEALIVDETKIDFDLFMMILRVHNLIIHISCKNTPNLKMKKFIDNRPQNIKKKKLLVGYEQLQYILKDKSIELSEKSWQNIQRSGFKKKHRLLTDGTLNLSNCQQLKKYLIIQLLEAYLEAATRINFENSRIEDIVLETISSKGKLITHLNLNGCNNITKAGLIRLCESKKMNAKFNLECILEVKHLIDMDVMTSISSSLFLKNIIYLDLSHIQMSNIDDGLMKICLSSKEVLLNIRVLDISNTWTSDRGLQILAVTQKLRKLEKIFFANCTKITERGIAYILDSGTLERLDIHHFISQCSDRFNGKVLDNLKYSSRKIFLREFNFKDSLVTDKELLNLFYDISKMFGIKSLDLRRTPYIGDEGLKQFYLTDMKQIEVLIVDPYRYDKLIPTLLYTEILPQLEAIIRTLNAQKKEANEVKGMAPKLMEKATNNANNNNNNNNNNNSTQNNNNNSSKSGGTTAATTNANGSIISEDKFVATTKTALLGLPPLSIILGQNGILEYEERRKKMKAQFSFEKIKNNYTYELQVSNILKQDNFYQDIFLNSQNLKQFHYDYFFYKHRQQLDDNIIFSLATSRLSFNLKTTAKSEHVNEMKDQQQLQQMNQMKKEEGEAPQDLINLANFCRFRYIDLSNVRSISAKTLCFFFQNFDFLIKVQSINLNNTNADEDVILSIASSNFVTELRTLTFDQCDAIQDISTPFMYMIFASKKNQDLLRKFFGIIPPVKQNDKNKAKTEEEKKEKLETLSQFDYYTLFQQYNSKLSPTAINVFLKLHLITTDENKKKQLDPTKIYFRQPPIRKLHFLNLEGSNLKGSQIIGIPKDVSLVNLCSSNLEYPDLKVFIQKAKYLWVEDTYNLQDEIFFHQVDQLLDLTLPYFSFMEFLYSKGNALNKGMKILQVILKKKRISYLDLNYFKQLPMKEIDRILTNPEILSNLRSLKFDFRYLQHSDTYLKVLEYAYSICQYEKLFILNFGKITAEQQYEVTPEFETKYNSKVMRENVRQKLYIDDAVVKGYPFVYHPFGNDVAKAEDDFVISKRFIEIVVEPFQLRELSLAGMNITKGIASNILFLMSKKNQLRTLILDDLPFVSDDFIILNLVKWGKGGQEAAGEGQGKAEGKSGSNSNALKKKDFEGQKKKEEEWEYRPFRYLNTLSVSRTRVTERSFMSILRKRPFSVNFKLFPLIQSYCQDRQFLFTNYSLEALAETEYLLNVNYLETIYFDYISHVLCKVLDSRYAINIQRIKLNYSKLNEQIFIKLASTKVLPNLTVIDLDGSSTCHQFFHYLIRAKYININFSIKDIVKQPGILAQTPFLLGMIDSIYTQQITVLNIENIDHDINQLEQVFKVSNYLFNLTNLSITCLRDSEANANFWYSIAESTKTPQLQILSVKTLITSNLKIMIKQESKPRIQIDKILYDNQEVLDDECFLILAEQPHLINIKELDLSKLNVAKRGVTSTTLMKLFLSKFAYNIERIVLGEDVIGDRARIGIGTDLVAQEYISEYLREQRKLISSDVDYKLIENSDYKQQMKADVKGEKEEGLYEKFLMFNNLKNLRELQFLSKDLINIRYLYFISKKVYSRQFQTLFNIGRFFYELQDLLYTFRASELKEIYKLIQKEIDLHGWFQNRQKVLYLDFFLPFTDAYNAIEEGVKRVDDFSCIEEIKFHATTNILIFPYFIYTEGMDCKPNFLNLKKITVSYSYFKYFFMTNVESGMRFFQRDFMEFGLFDGSSFVESMLLNYDVDNASGVTRLRQIYSYLEMYGAKMMEKMTQMIFYIDDFKETELIDRLFNAPVLGWKKIHIRLRGKDIDETQVSVKQRVFQSHIISLIVKYGGTKLKDLDQLVTITRISFEQYFDLEIQNVFSKKFSRLNFIEQRVDLNSTIRPDQVNGLLKHWKQFTNTHVFFLPQIQKPNAAAPTAADEVQKSKLHTKPQQANGDSDAVFSKFFLHRMLKLKKLFIRSTFTWTDLVYLYEKVIPNNPGMSVTFSSLNHEPMVHYLQNISNISKNKGKDWTEEFKYITFLFNDDKAKKKEEIVQAILTNESAKYFISKIVENDDDQVLGVFYKVFTNVRTGQNQELKPVQGVVAIEQPAQQQQQQQQQTQQANQQQSTVAKQVPVTNQAKGGNTQASNNNNNNANNTNNNNNNKNNNNKNKDGKDAGKDGKDKDKGKQGQVVIPNKNAGASVLQNASTVVASVAAPAATASVNSTTINSTNAAVATTAVGAAGVSAQQAATVVGKFSLKNLKFYTSRISLNCDVDLSKEVEFMKCFPCLLELIIVEKKKQNYRMNEKQIENAIHLLEICLSPITIQNVFLMLSCSMQQKHFKMIKDLKRFKTIKKNIFVISFFNNQNIFIKNTSDRRVYNKEGKIDEEAAKNEIKAQQTPGDDPGQNQYDNQLNEDNDNVQEANVSGEVDKLSEFESDEKGKKNLLRQKSNEFEDYEEEQKVVNQVEKVDNNDNNENNQQKNAEQEAEDLLKLDKKNNQEQLSAFVGEFQALQELNFSYSSISKEQFVSLFEKLKKTKNFDSVLLYGCEVADPEGILQAVLNYLDEEKTNQQGKKNPNKSVNEGNKKTENRRYFQLEKFIQSIKFEATTVINLKFMNTLITSKHFMRTIKFLQLPNLFGVYSSQNEFKQIIMPFLSCQNLDTSSFLQQNKIQSQIDDDLIVHLTKQKDNISYISPDTFTNVKYGFNLLLQQKCIDFDEKLLYFLNTSFQKSLSGTSFFEVYQFMFDQNQLKNRFDYILSMNKDLFNIVKVFRIQMEYCVSQIERFIGYNDPVSIDISQWKDTTVSIERILMQFSEDPKIRQQRSKYQEIFKESVDVFMQMIEKNTNQLKEIEEIEKQNKQSNTINQQEQSQLKPSQQQQQQQQQSQSLNDRSMLVGSFKNKGFKDYQKDKERFILQFNRHSNHIAYMIEQYFIKLANLRKKESRQISLLDFVENLNLKNNSFFNYSGLNSYVTNHITPWLKLNNGISKIKEKRSLRSSKIIDESNAHKDKTYSKLVSPDHKLDDEILFHLLFIINQDLKNLRSIELIGLNVGDRFAFKLSNILSDRSKLLKLMLLDLSNNRRLTSYGMKYIYSSIVSRVGSGLRIILTSNKQEQETIEQIMQETLIRINLIERIIAKNQQDLSRIGGSSILKSSMIGPGLKLEGEKEKDVSATEGNQIKDNPVQDSESKGLLDKSKSGTAVGAASNDPAASGEPQQNLLLLNKKGKDNQLEQGQQFGWSFIEDPLQEELKYLNMKYEKYQDIYKKCQSQISEQGDQVQIEDAAIVLQNLASLGFYESIHRLVSRRWRNREYFFVIFIAIMFFFFTVVQVMMYLAFKIQQSIEKRWDLYLLRRSSQKVHKTANQLKIHVSKRVPLILREDDFYFDNDILMINQILSSTSSSMKENKERQRLLKVKQFLQSPWSHNSKMLNKSKEQSQLSILKYSSHLMLASYLIYLLGFMIIVPLLQIYTEIQDQCNNINALFDFMFIGYCILSLICESILCAEVQYIVGSKRICNISYFSMSMRLFFSLVLKYDQYTDIQFAIYLYNCNVIQQKTIGIIQSIFILISLVRDFLFVAYYQYMLYVSRKTIDDDNYSNTYFINLFANFALPVQMSALQKLLEKFSTIASQISDFFLIPSNLRNIRVPIDFFPRVWRITFGNLPTLVLYFYLLLFGNIGFSINDWSNQRIFISSLLSFIYCGHQAWTTKPSTFTSFQMKENVDFVSEEEESYQLKFEFDNRFTFYQYDEILKKLMLFIEINPLIEFNDYKQIGKTAKTKYLQDEIINKHQEKQKNMGSQANIASSNDLWQDPYENQQQIADVNAAQTRQQEFLRKLKVYEQEQTEEFELFKQNLYNFLLYKKLNWEQFNQRGLVLTKENKEDQGIELIINGGEKAPTNQSPGAAASAATGTANNTQK